jgi:hypothetical protein
VSEFKGESQSLAGLNYALIPIIGAASNWIGNGATGVAFVFGLEADFRR